MFTSYGNNSNKWQLCCEYCWAAYLDNENFNFLVLVHFLYGFKPAYLTTVMSGSDTVYMWSKLCIFYTIYYSFIKYLFYTLTLRYCLLSSEKVVHDHYIYSFRA